MKLSHLSVLTVLVLTAACADTGTDPLASDGPETVIAMSPVGNGGNGNGAEFVTSPYTGISHGDGAGNVCQVQNLDRGEDDLSDWQRVDKKGNVYLHIQDAVATMTLSMANGDVFTGEGRWSVNWHFGLGTDMSHARGTVSNGAESFNATCKFVRTKSGQLNLTVSVF